jgi:ferredoxin
MAAAGGGQAELAVDRIRCDGRGLCAELLPELVRLDDWGYPIVATGPIPDHLLGHAKRAVAACPVLALALRRSQQAPRRLPANSK